MLDKVAGILQNSVIGLNVTSFNLVDNIDFIPCTNYM
jgi:hypothetical protein